MSLLAITALLLLTLFIAGWWWSIKIRNASLVDAMWALALILPVGIYVFHHEGNQTRDYLLLGMALVWSLRLGFHLAVRIFKHHPQEDARYRVLRERWNNQSNRNFLVIFLINALLVFLLALPFYTASQNRADISPLEWVGLVIFCIGWLGETVSDRQLASFLKNKQGKAVCEVGLWNYSRHPNYFFEAVIWVGIYVFCAASPMGIYTILAPVIMILLLTKVTGIPPAERSSLESKGDAYRQYQRTTSAFVPWFKRKL